MTEKPWTTGDVVRLKSGGPKMTVRGVASGGAINCEWFAKEAVRKESFAPEMLERALTDSFLAGIAKTSHDLPSEREPSGDGEA